MPTLDDTTTLQKNVAIAANDAVCISNKDSDASSQIQQVPVALIGLGFTHAWVINYDNAELAGEIVDDTDEEIKLLDIPQNSIITKAMFVVTEAFTGLTACNAFLGKAGSSMENDYIETTSLLAKIAKVNVAGDEIDAFGEIDVVTASDKDLVVTFDPAANTEALGTDLTAGQLVILVALTEIDDFKDLVPAT
tara:strand:+ start:4090 stop:4668 length:579 start_codon:yes stop_codon:yes gene_type:complete